MLRSVKRLPLALAISAATLAVSAQAQQLEEVIVTAQNVRRTCRTFLFP